MRLNTIINGIVILFLIWIFGIIYFAERGKRLTAERNLTASLRDKSLQIEVTKRQADRLYGATIDSLARALKVKPKQIVRWQKAEIEYRDTGSVVIVQPRIDTVKIYPDSVHGRVEKDCYTIDILLYQNRFYTELQYRDELTPVIYRERPRRIWFVKFGRWQYRVEILSKCEKTKISVFENVYVKGR